MVLMGVRKGMSPKEAARSIRRWIPEAEDKILTTIELNEKTEVSEFGQQQQGNTTKELKNCLLGKPALSQRQNPPLNGCWFQRLLSSY